MGSYVGHVVYWLLTTFDSREGLQVYHSGEITHIPDADSSEAFEFYQRFTGGYSECLWLIPNNPPFMGALICED